MSAANWYTAKSEDTLQKQALLAEGKAQYMVISAAVKKSRIKVDENGVETGGKPMLELILQVTDFEGRSARVWVYLLTEGKMEYLLRHFCASCGLLSAYESNTLNPKDCHNRKGWLILGLKTDNYNGKSRMKNFVDDFVVPEGYQSPQKQNTQQGTQQAKQQVESIDSGFHDDDIPM